MSKITPTGIKYTVYPTDFFPTLAQWFSYVKESVDKAKYCIQLNPTQTTDNNGKENSHSHQK